MKPGDEVLYAWEDATPAELQELVIYYRDRERALRRMMPVFGVVVGILSLLVYAVGRWLLFP